MSFLRFFWIAFSETVRESSLTDAKEFKLIRRKSEERRDVWTIFHAIAHRNIAALATFHPPSPLPPILLYQGDVLEVAPYLSSEEYDLLLTSPPYGDSRTTVAYGQFSRLSLWWLGYMEDVDKAALGSQRRPFILIFLPLFYTRFFLIFSRKTQSALKKYLAFSQTSMK